MTTEEVDLDAVAEEYGWLYIVWVLSQPNEYAMELLMEMLDRRDIAKFHKHVRDIIEREVYKIK